MYGPWIEKKKKQNYHSVRNSFYKKKEDGQKVEERVAFY